MGISCRPTCRGEGRGRVSEWLKITTMPRSDRLNRQQLLERQAFQLGLVDRLKSIDAPLEAVAIVAEALGRRLGVAEAGYSDVATDDRWAQILYEWTGAGGPGLAGQRFELARLGRFALAELRAGRSLVLGDTDKDAKTRERMKHYRAAGIRSVVVVPLLRDGRLTALLFVRDSNPRQWSEYELALIEDMARRTHETVERARAEAALRASEQRYRSLFNSIDAGFCVIEMHFDADDNARDYRFLDVNEAFENYTGIANAAGRWMREIAPDHEQHWFDIYGRVARTGNAERFELPARALGDRWYMVHAYRIDDPALNHVAVLFTDLSERRRTERKLEQSREELELAARTARLGRFDYRPLEDDLQWDDRCRELFGLSPGVSVTYRGSFLAGLHPDDRKRLDDVVQAVLDPHGSREFHAEYRTIGLEDGEERHVVADGIAFFKDDVPTRLVGTVLDVTEDRRAQANLRETEERLRLAARATNDAIWDWDLRQDFVRWNESLERAYGHRPDQVRPDGAWWIENIHPEDRDRIDRTIHAVIDGGGTDWSDEYRFRRADGSYADVFDRGYVIRNEAGAPVRMIGAMLDLTTRKELERELRRENKGLEEAVATTTAERDKAEEALRQSQKMEAVGQLTGGLAHDFNNLLTGISGALELMRIRIGQGRVNDLERYSVMAEEAVKRAAALTHRLLAFSRRQTLDPRATDANRLIEGMRDLIDRTVGPAIDLSLDLSPDLWVTMVDPNQLENALLNLSINARDAMPEGGTIRIASGNRSFDPSAARERGLEPGDYLAVSVTDNGTGMTPDIVDRAFEPFYTTKPMGDGTGLGLSMIYGFAHQSGGQAHIRSQPGSGTTVSIYLPRHDGGPSGPDVEASRPALPKAARQATILVVDDEPSVRGLVAEIVEEIGCRAVQAADGAEALGILRSAQSIDLMITDVGLPGGMNGRNLAAAAMEMRPLLKVLFITGYEEMTAMRNDPLPPHTSMMTKPFAMDALAGRVRDLLR